MNFKNDVIGKTAVTNSEQIQTPANSKGKNKMDIEDGCFMDIPDLIFGVKYNFKKSKKNLPF